MTVAEQPAELASYFREARSWDGDRVAQALRRARTAWRAAAAALVCCLASIVALMLLIPLKQTEPYLVRVDNATGIVDVVPVYSAQVPMDETVTRYFLSHYVTVCERFNLSTAESDYEECGAFHSAQRNQAWYALWNPNNPRSPLNLHKDGSTVAVQVQAVSFFKRASGVNDTAQVRYVKSERPGGGGDGRDSHWIATIQYAYATPSADPRVRRWNPLGFKLLDFVTELESP
ncbi:MAG TPA: VirB8/TrbF family protein [Steroidobacteraceae bacterium]|jgi:type IV secretion system protein VirB8